MVDNRLVFSLWGGNSGTQVYQQDSTVPAITFTDGGYTAGTWTATQQTIQVTATGGA